MLLMQMLLLHRNESPMPVPVFDWKSHLWVSAVTGAQQIRVRGLWIETERQQYAQRQSPSHTFCTNTSLAKEEREMVAWNTSTEEEGV